jgi:hypothetical protein
MGAILHIADYIVLRESSSGDSLPEFTLNRRDPDQDVGLRIHLPAGAVVDERSILAFVADPASYSEDLKYEVSIVQHWHPPGNQPGEHWSKTIGRGTFTGGVARGLWFVIDGDILNLQTPPFTMPGHGTVNDGTLSVTAWFKLNDGSGLVTFKDVVLWFQRKVAEAPSE